MILRKLFPFVFILMTGCSALTTQIPLGSQPDSPIATATSFRFFWDSNVSVSTPEGISLTYGSKPSENTPLGSFWMKSTLDSITALANSQAAQAAMQGYMMGSGGGIPALGAQSSGKPSALQQMLQEEGCPLAEKLSPVAFQNLLSALSGAGVGMDKDSLLEILGGSQ